MVSVKRRRVSAKNKRRHAKVVHRIVKMKVKYNLSGKQLRQFVQIYNTVEAETILNLVRKDFRNEGYCAHRLHGCAGCEDYIWLKTERQVCPNCNNMDGGYDAAGAPCKKCFTFRCYRD